MSYQHENEHFISQGFQDFLLACEAKMLRPATIVFYVRMLNPFLEWLDFRELTSREIRKFLKLRGEQVAPGTVHAHARAIRAFTRFLHREGWIESQIPIDMPRVDQRPVTVLTVEEIRRIISVCSNARDRALILIMIDTGLRRGEVVAVRWSDIDFGDGTILVRKSKSRRYRIVPVGVKARRALMAWRRKSSEPFVFPLRTSGLRMALWRISRRADVSFTAHDLRRTSATFMLRAGATAFHVKEVLGHRSLVTTQRYISLAGTDLVAGHKRYGVVDRLL